MKELIERLEKATESERELDLAIYRATSGHDWRWHPGFPPQTVITYDQYGPGAAGNPVVSLEHLTASIDDALTLKLPKDRLRELGQWNNNWEPGGWFARIEGLRRDGDSWILREFQFGVPEPDSHVAPPLAPNGAIALCIAALKAREAGK